MRIRIRPPRHGTVIAFAVAAGLAVAGLLVVGIVHWVNLPPPLDAGTVVAKDFAPAHDDYIPGYYIQGSCQMIGKVESCSPGIDIPPRWDHYDDSWHVQLSDGTRKSWRTVSHALYDATPVGTELDLSQ